MIDTGLDIQFSHPLTKTLLPLTGITPAASWPQAIGVSVQRYREGRYRGEGHGLSYRPTRLGLQPARGLCSLHRPQCSVVCTHMQRPQASCSLHHSTTNSYRVSHKTDTPIMSHNSSNKSSAVAEMGDRLATIGMGRKWGGAAVGAADGSPLGPHLTQCGLGRGLPLYQVAS